MAQELDLNNLTPQQKADIMYAYDRVPQWSNILHADGTMEWVYGPDESRKNAREYVDSWDAYSPADQQRIAGQALSNPDFAASYTVRGVDPIPPDDPAQPPGGTAGSGNQFSGPYTPMPISIDLGAYELDPQAQADVQTVRNITEGVANRDANRYAVDPSQIPAIESYWYDPATADIYQTDIGEVFDPTRSQYGYANDLVDYASQLDGSHLGSAADLAYLAATGQTPSRADMALNRDANALYASQMAMAARARGSSSAGLATMNAQNNANLGYAQLLNNADMARAQEATDARNLYGQLGGTIRQGDLAAASQAAEIAQGMYAVNNSELSAMQGNTNAMNQGSQYNTGIVNEAGQFRAGQSQSASAGNQAFIGQTLTQNSDRAAGVGKADDSILQGYTGQILGVGQDDRTASIEGQKDLQQAYSNATDSANNYSLGLGNQSAGHAGVMAGADATRDAAIMGAIGTGIAGIAQVASGYGNQNPGSDERMKNVHGKGKPADFSNVKPMRWSYDAEHEDDEGTEWLEDGEEMESGMANDMPDDVVEDDENGMLHVNMKKLMMRIPDALGDVQRRIAKLEGKR
jgi:hypothetical protein